MQKYLTHESLSGRQGTKTKEKDIGDGHTLKARRGDNRDTHLDSLDVVEHLDLAGPLHHLPLSDHAHEVAVVDVRGRPHDDALRVHHAVPRPGRQGLDDNVAVLRGDASPALHGVHDAASPVELFRRVCFFYYYSPRSAAENRKKEERSQVRMEDHAFNCERKYLAVIYVRLPKSLHARQRTGSASSGSARS